MIIAACFLAPLLLYFGIYVFDRNRPQQQSRLARASVIAAVLIAVISSMAVLVVLFSSRWPEGTQIAWTGIERTGSSLVVGGPREEATVGWPNGSFAPRVQVTASSDNMASIEVTEGDAFVFDDSKNVFLNGVSIALGESRTFGNYTIRTNRSILFWNQRVEVMTTSNNETLATFYLPAHHVRLLLTAERAIRILEKDQKWEAQCSWPCRVSVLWPNSKLPLVIMKNAGNLKLDFLPPWRLASPIPPESNDKEIHLTISGRALPGDTAFLLPLGNGVSDPRAILSISKRSGRAPVFSSPGAILRDPESERDNYLPPSTVQPSTKEPDSRTGETSWITVRAGPISFLLATVNDLPSTRKILILVLVAFLSLVLGLILCFPRMPDISRWGLYGVVAVFWNLLAFRLLLALRYSLDPSYLDGLVVKGVATAFISLAIAPGFVLLVGRLSRDYFARPSNKGERNRCLRYALGYLLWLGTAFLIQYRFVQTLWPNLPARFALSLGVPFTLFLIAAFLYVMGCIYFMYKTEPGDPRFPLFGVLFLSPLTFIDKFSKGGRRLWTRITGQSSSNRAKLVRYVVAAVLWFTVIPFGLSLIPGRKFFQEVVAPLLFCWPFAIFWLSARLLPSSAKKGQRASWKLVTVCAVLTILLPVFFLPLAISDVGSILAMLAI